ncbi:MAG: hypothetical protein NXI04_02995 [Planctomycetaceae bacterium]|nr:hypothetical protein [Planctomycetaceae bacterium]
MTPRSVIFPGVLADMAASAPSRLQKKLDKSPEVARSWEWTADGDVWAVQAGGETVQLLSHVISSVDDVACTCLLAPRCFHVLAVLSVLEIAATDAEHTDDNGVDQTAQSSGVSLTGEGPVGEAADDSAGGDSVSTDDPSVSVQYLSAGQRQAVAGMRRVQSGLLSAGLRAAGTVLQSRLLRSIHECRSEGLHRLAAAALRIMTNIRAVRADSEAFDSAQAVADVQEALEVTHWLSQQAATSSAVADTWVGTARRRYHPVNSLKLHGLCCEPVLTRSGYSGVVTWMMDDGGGLCTVSDVQPGDASRIPQAWRSGVSVAGLALPHQELSRGSLLISKATRSRDGRLGGAESARAVAIEGTGWEAPPIRAAFARPREDQIEAAFAAQRLPEVERPAGSDLLFLEVEVLGCAESDLIVSTADGRVLRLGISIDRDGVSFRENVSMLARAPGLRVRCVVRMNFSQAGCASLLAIGPPAETGEGPQLRFLDSLLFHADVGLDLVERGCLTSAERSPVSIDAVADQSDDVGHDDILARWLQAIVLGGRHAVPTGAVDGAVQDAARLNRQLRPTAAAVLCRLVESAVATQTDLLGVRFPADGASLTQNWLAAAAVRRATVDAVQQHDWLATNGVAHLANAFSETC